MWAIAHRILIEKNGICWKLPAMTVHNRPPYKADDGHMLRLFLFEIDLKLKKVEHSAYLKKTPFKITKKYKSSQTFHSSAWSRAIATKKTYRAETRVIIILTRNKFPMKVIICGFECKKQTKYTIAVQCRMKGYIKKSELGSDQ